MFNIFGISWDHGATRMSRLQKPAGEICQAGDRGGDFFRCGSWVGTRGWGQRFQEISATATSTTHWRPKQRFAKIQSFKRPEVLITNRRVRGKWMQMQLQGVAGRFSAPGLVMKSWSNGRPEGLRVFPNALTSADGRSARCNLRPQLCAFLGDGALDSRSLHLTFVVDDDPGIVLEVDEDAFTVTPGFLLADHHAFEDLLSKLRLSLFHAAKHQIPGRAIGQLVQATANADHGKDVEILGTAVVSTVQQRCHTATLRHAHLALLGGSTLLHFVYSYLPNLRFSTALGAKKQQAKCDRMHDLNIS